jgi:hypothetical protein
MFTIIVLISHQALQVFQKQQMTYQTLKRLFGTVKSVKKHFLIKKNKLYSICLKSVQVLQNQREEAVLPLHFCQALIMIKAVVPTSKANILCEG